MENTSNFIAVLLGFDNGDIISFKDLMDDSDAQDSVTAVSAILLHMSSKAMKANPILGTALLAMKYVIDKPSTTIEMIKNSFDSIIQDEDYDGDPALKEGFIEMVGHLNRALAASSKIDLKGSTTMN